MVRWPGQGGDEGEEGKYSDVARRPPGRVPGSGATEARVRDIIRRSGSQRVVDIARQLHEERSGPSVPFAGRDKKNAQHQVSHILRQMKDRGEVESQRGRGSSTGGWASWWRLKPQADDDPGAPSPGPEGAPKPSWWSGGHARAGEGRPENRRPRGGGYGVTRPAEPDPGPTWQERRDARRQAALERRRANPLNPENWGRPREDLADESDRNRRVREQRAERERRWRENDPTNPENWGKRGKGKGGGGGSSGGGSGLGIFRAATPKDPDDDDPDDDGGGLGIFKKA